MIFLERHSCHVQKYTLCRPAARSLALPCAYPTRGRPHQGPKCERRHLPSSLCQMVHSWRCRFFHLVRYSAGGSTHLRRLSISRCLTSSWSLGEASVKPCPSSGVDPWRRFRRWLEGFERTGSWLDHPQSKTQEPGSNPRVAELPAWFVCKLCVSPLMK